MAFPSRTHIVLAAAVAFAAPSAFVACDLVPLPVPETTGGTTTSGNGGTSGASGAPAGGNGGGGGVAGAPAGGNGGGGGVAGAAAGGNGGGGGVAGAAAGGNGGGGGVAGAAAGGSTGGGGAAGAPASGGGGSGGTGGEAMDGGSGGSACSPVVTTFPLDPSPHVAVCSVVTYTTNPPTSGPHYPSWAAFKTYTTPVPRGFYVHSLEHGAIVVQYNCPAGCDAEVAALIAYLDARPPDPLCAAPSKNRFIVTPDPLLDVPFAASAWGASLRAQCFDLAALGAFIDAYYAKAPENFCFDGVDPTDPASGIPADCGQPMDAGSD